MICINFRLFPLFLFNNNEQCVNTFTFIFSRFNISKTFLQKRVCYWNTYLYYIDDRTRKLSSVPEHLLLSRLSWCSFCFFFFLLHLKRFDFFFLPFIYSILNRDKSLVKEAYNKLFLLFTKATKKNGFPFRNFYYSILTSKMFRIFNRWAKLLLMRHCTNIIL